MTRNSNLLTLVSQAGTSRVLNDSDLGHVKDMVLESVVLLHQPFITRSKCTFENLRVHKCQLLAEP